jgi:hypothetical protein
MTTNIGNNEHPTSWEPPADTGDRWHRIQSEFVDDPRKSVAEAHELVSDLLKRVVDNFTQERGALERQWSEGERVSTEDLRVCLQRYRAFFSRLLPSAPGGDSGTTSAHGSSGLDASASPLRTDATSARPNAFDKSSSSNATDKSARPNATDKSSTLNATDKTTRPNATDKSSTLNATDKTARPNATDKSVPVSTTDKSVRANATDRSSQPDPNDGTVRSEPVMVTPAPRD